LGTAVFKEERTKLMQMQYKNFVYSLYSIKHASIRNTTRNGDFLQGNKSYGPLDSNGTRKYLWLAKCGGFSVKPGGTHRSHLSLKVLGEQNEEWEKKHVCYRCTETLLSGLCWKNQ
jgi:hypothetical protein